jgi:MFS family permease
MASRLPPPLRFPQFRLLVAAILTMRLAGQMIAVAIGWQVYAIHQDPLDLGLIGLAEFAPLPLLALPAGQLADRVPRRLVFVSSLLLNAAVPLCLLVVTVGGATVLWPFFALAVANGVSTAVGNPAVRALPPALVPLELLPQGLALRSIVHRSAAVAGPAVGGFLFAVRAEAVYAVSAVLFGVAIVCVLRLRAPVVERTTLTEPPARLDSLLAGLKFIRRTPILLGAISLDLFAVLLGGAVALLPLFARTVLHTGPAGLGILRSAPAVGGLVAAMFLANRSIGPRAGRTLLAMVALFGASMIVFGLSRAFPLSLAALAVSGFADMYSVNIRATIATLATPDELRGRVLAVEMVFISASNELGAFESGVAAALLGAVPAVVAGGLATVALALIWARVFPPLAEVGRLEELRPVPMRT